MLSNRIPEEKPLKGREMLTAMIIFLLPLVAIFSITDVNFPRWMNIFVFILFWGLILFAVGQAVIKRLPHWSMPYLGIVLMPAITLISLPLFGAWLYPRFLQLFGSRSNWSLPTRIIYIEIFEFFWLFSILLGAFILVNLLRLLPYTQGVWNRIRADWTQLSFIIYAFWRACFSHRACI